VLARSKRGCTFDCTQRLVGEATNGAIGPQPISSVLVEPFTAYVASERNESVDRVEQLVKIGTTLEPFVERLYGTEIENSFTELLALSRCSNEDLPRVVDLICSRHVSKVSDAKRLILGGGALSQSASARAQDRSGILMFRFETDFLGC
jgi:hypothetical protein